MVRLKQSKLHFPVELVNISLDTTDGGTAKSSPSIFSWFDLIGVLYSIISFLIDTGSDIAVATIHYQNGDYWYFGLTAFFIVVPAVVMTVFSMIWYLQDFRKNPRRHSPTKWVIRIIILTLQMGPILRYVDSLIYGLKSRNETEKKKQLYYQKMIYEDCDAAFLRLFEAFMEAAPQLVLQIYIVTKNSPHSTSDFRTVAFQGFTIFTSLISLSWAMAYYHRSLRFSIVEKDKISWFGTISQILWYSFVIAGRVLSLGLLAVISPIGLAVFSIVHWAVMSGWIMTMKTKFCDTRFQEFCYNAVLGIVFIFHYINPIDQRTRYKYTFYYIIMFIEDTTIMALWYHLCTDPLLWFRLPALLFHFLSFSVGIFIMILYYLLLHPSKNIKVCDTSYREENNIGEEHRKGQTSECEC